MADTTEQAGLFVAGRIVQIGQETKGGGKFATIAAGEALLKVFFGKEKLVKIVAPFEPCKYRLTSNGDGFISVL